MFGDVLLATMNKNLFLASMPRAGTHLMEAILSRLSGRHMSRFYKPDVYNYPAVAEVVEKLRYRHFAFLGHIRYPEALRLTEVANSPHWCTLVLIRDPRDIALSVDRDEGAAWHGQSRAATTVWSDWRVVDEERLPNGAVRAYMSTDLVTTVAGATIADLAQIMTNAHVRRIIIVDGENKPIGIVSATDILAALARAGAGQPFQPEARASSFSKEAALS